MQTIRLRVSDQIYKNLMWFLKRFNKEEIQIIEEDDNFLSVKAYLTKELELLENGQSELVDMEELNSQLESTIKKYED